MRIIYMGSGEFGCETLRRLLEIGHDIVQVITQPARPAGRGRHLMPTPIARLAHELALPVLEVANVNEPEILEKITQLQPQLAVVIAFGQKLSNELLSTPGCRFINLHGSLLPKYRGAAPINWAIINGEEETGVTVIEINEIFDAGDILGRDMTLIMPCETASELHDRLANMGPDIIESVIKKIHSGTDQPLVQEATEATRAPKLKKVNGAINWKRSAEEICQQINGMWSWPGAYCYLQQPHKDKPVRLSVARASVLLDSSVGQLGIPGTVNDVMAICCGTGVLQILEVKPENSSLMSFHDFSNGRQLNPESVFVDG